MAFISDTSRDFRPAPSLVAVVAQQWRTLMKDLFDPYRPERHYMRGPGPKWREKHAQARRAQA